MPSTRKAVHRPLAHIPGKVRASIHRGRLTPSEHVKYLDLAALERVGKAVIEVGSLKVAGRTVPVVAEVRKGMVVALRPTHCTDCTPSKRSAAGNGSARARAAKAALRKVHELGLPPLRLPISVASLRRGLFGITVTIIVDYEVCLVIEFDDGSVCFWCTQTRSFCIQP
jgi:hypothetical protein